MDCSIPGLPVPHHLTEFAQGHVHCISDAIQPLLSSYLILWHLLLLLSIFLSIRDFSNESAIHIRWPKYWSFNFIITLFKESVQFSCSVVSNSLWPHEPQHSRPPCPKSISLKIDWFAKLSDTTKWRLFIQNVFTFSMHTINEHKH